MSESDYYAEMPLDKLIETLDSSSNGHINGAMIRPMVKEIIRRTRSLVVELEAAKIQTCGVCESPQLKE